MTIAYAGERGAFAELAAITYFGGREKMAAQPEFSDVFKAVAAGRCRYGVVPLENSLAGSIHLNYDLLLENDLFIVGEVLLRIHQFLIANKGVARKDLRRIYSHQAVFPQCRNYLKKIPHVFLAPVSNTAAAVKKIKEEGLTDAAAIASAQAAAEFGMRVLASNIEDSRWNATRFIVVSKSISPVPLSVKNTKSSVVFSLKDIPGALTECLNVFAKRGINLYKIESRPVHRRAKSFAYLFYLDFEGDARDKAHRDAMKELEKTTSFYRFLGSYPVGLPSEPEGPAHRKK